MLKLVGCKSIEDYNALKAEVLETILDEPFSMEEKDKNRGKKGRKGAEKHETESKGEQDALMDSNPEKHKSEAKAQHDVSINEDTGKGNLADNIKQRILSRELDDLDGEERFWPIDPNMRIAAIKEEIKIKEFKNSLSGSKNVEVHEIPNALAMGDDMPTGKVSFTGLASAGMTEDIQQIEYPHSESNFYEETVSGISETSNEAERNEMPIGENEFIQREEINPIHSR